MDFYNCKINQKVLAPSYMRHVKRHRQRVFGIIIDKGVFEGFELINVWQYNHEPKCMAGWFTPDKLEAI